MTEKLLTKCMGMDILLCSCVLMTIGKCEPLSYTKNKIPKWTSTTLPKWHTTCISSNLLLYLAKNEDLALT